VISQGNALDRSLLHFEKSTGQKRREQTFQARILFTKATIPPNNTTPMMMKI
jgi:hypothetical protein